MGELLTAATHDAWENLKEHVSKGCLCDPPGINLFTYEREEPTSLGGESFRAIGTQRGTSALEGFHTHQKEWFGTLAHHGVDAGMALLAEGTLRWNRKRSRPMTMMDQTTPPSTTTLRRRPRWAAGALTVSDQLRPRGSQSEEGSK